MAGVIGRVAERIAGATRKVGLRAADFLRRATVLLLRSALRINIPAHFVLAAGLMLLGAACDGQVEIPSEEVPCASSGAPREPLTFTFENWLAEEESGLRQYLDRMIPLINQYFGPPAYGNQVTISKNESRRRAFYDACLNKITLSGINSESVTALPHELAHAYHDDFHAVTVEEGMATLLASHVNRTYLDTYGADELIVLDPNSLTPVVGYYDLNNQRELSEPWTCYIQDLPVELINYLDHYSYVYPYAALRKMEASFPSFMIDFNEALYQGGPEGLAQIGSFGEGLAGFIGNRVLPPGHPLEGKSFADWLDLQYSLRWSWGSKYKIYVEFKDLSDWSGDFTFNIYTWTHEASEEVSERCRPYGTGIEREYRGPVSIQISDFQENEAFAETRESTNGILPNNRISLPAVINSQRMKLKVELATPEGTTEAKEIYFPFCVGAGLDCPRVGYQNDHRITGILTGVPPVSANSGSIEIEAEIIFGDRSYTRNMSTRYDQGYFLTDYLFFDEEGNRAEKAFLRFRVIPDDAGSPQFEAERIWADPQYHLHVNLNAEE